MSNVKEDSPTPPESSAGREELGLDVVFDQERLSKGPITNAYECHVCSACKQQFDSPDLVVLFEEEAFHTECFCCGECGSVVDATQEFLVLEGGSPLCSSCSPSCHACGEKVLSRHVGVLNKDFHEACLKCSQCQKVFGAVAKVYSCGGGEPCCAECVTPVFDETWSPHSGGHTHTPGRTRRESASSSCDMQALLTNTVTVATPTHRTLPPRLETLSQTVSDLPAARFHTLLRPSFSVPVLSSQPRSEEPLSLSSLKAILYDELGVSLLMNYCVEMCCIELVIFWLDVEHFRYFDGDNEDMKLFAHHIMLKYIGYYAELPIELRRETAAWIVEEMQKTTFSQEMFNEAQEHVYQLMERTVLEGFLQHQDGRHYLEALVSRDNHRREKQREIELQMSKPILAIVTKFDKRHLDTKFYVYEIQVLLGEEQFMIYRRYSEFHSLQQELKAALPDHIKLPPLPKKIIFGRSQTKQVAQQRMMELQAYLQGVLSMPAEVSHCRVLLAFLAQTGTDKEDEAFNARLLQSQQA